MTPDECPRPDCPLPHLDEPTRAGVDALPPAVREAIRRAWCRVSGLDCAGALAWHLVNHAERGRTTHGSNKRSNTRPGVSISGVVQDETRRLP